jgi:TolA-binding protein
MSSISGSIFVKRQVVLRFRSRHRAIQFFSLSWLMAAAICLSALAPSAACAAESTEESLAAYADAANFQTGGATALAIDAWNKFLKDYPDDEMASKAAHYLGVCHMQKESPDYVAASKAFARALQDNKYELREESLVNQGWCLYANAGDGPQRDPALLRKTIETFATLRKENPNSQFLDRVHFYSGEAAFGLGDAKQAIEHYNALLALPNANQSPLLCDALYARGVANESLDQFDQAVASFEQLLGSCQTNDLVTDVHLRIGDAMILRKDYDRAVSSFDAAIASTDADEDRSYALFRQGYALVQANRPAEAAAKYEKLSRDFPNSQYAATATLASAQSSYRGGDLKAAAPKFERVLQQQNVAAATEAAHWLARIHIQQGDPAQAVAVARQQLNKGVEGDYAVDLKVVLAEALSMDPQTIAESIEVAEQAYRDAPQDPLAPRALYNAAFSALQSNQMEQATKLANEFLSKFPGDTLAADVRFIAAEGQLLAGKLDDAAASYRQLLKQSSPQDSVQRPLWVLRAATTYNLAKKYSDTLELVRSELKNLPQSAQQAELLLLAGQANAMLGKHSDAALSFQQSLDADDAWPRVDECRLLFGQALLAAGKKNEAQSAWQQLISKGDNARMADQARYKLAQMESLGGNFREAIKRYDEILSSEQDPGLIPYSLYGKGWSLMQVGDYQQALAPLDKMLAEYQQHPMRDDSLLARGIARRNLDQYQPASQDLTDYLSLKPQGTNLGHALYELALIDQKQKQPAKAAERLKQLVTQVPDYPGMDKVLYELGWSLREAGDQDEAAKQFTDLVRRYPNASVAADAAYFVGQRSYTQGDWAQAAREFAVAAKKAEDKQLSEKAHYRLGWSYFKLENYPQAEQAFADQAAKHGDGRLAIDALMMIGECRFKEGKFPAALSAYEVARQRIRENNETAENIRDPAERQVRELVLLHGGQSAAQNKQWDTAIEWYDELKERFPATNYLSQVFYETAYAYQQKKDLDQALKLYAEVADNYRNVVAARARFMMGEIFFGRREFDKAIPEFQRVMFGFGAAQAPPEIKNWQAKSGFEAGRCSELLMQQATSDEKRRAAKGFATDFFKFVVEKHPNHELAEKSRERLEALDRS